jgi:ABC-type sugar transport system substrate-binding protein
MRIRRLLAALVLTGTLLAALAGGAAADANPADACLVGVIVSGSAEPGFGQETAGLAQAGTLDPAGVAATYCH